MIFKNNNFDLLLYCTKLLLVICHPYRCLLEYKIKKLFILNIMNNKLVLLNKTLTHRIFKSNNSFEEIESFDKFVFYVF